MLEVESLQLWTATGRLPLRQFLQVGIEVAGGVHDLAGPWHRRQQRDLLPGKPRSPSARILSGVAGSNLRRASAALRPAALAEFEEGNHGSGQRPFVSAHRLRNSPRKGPDGSPGTAASREAAGVS